jgi:GTP pyrophosphokinase
METVAIDDEKKEILRHYRKLLRVAKPVLKEGDAKLIKKAFNTSLQAHQGMRRKTGEPYILHPLAVAQIAVEEIGLGTTSIIAALLHDVVEDTELEVEDISKHFGLKVAKIIDGLTKISGTFEHGSSLQAENFRKMLLTLSDDVRVILVKLADRLHNMRTLESMPRDKQLKIASESMYLYAPLAHRLGLYAIKTEMEDLYLKYTEYDTYRHIVEKLRTSRDARNKFIKDFIAPILSELKKQGFQFEIKGRPKSIFSIHSKMRKQQIPFEEVYDLFAVRIIIDTEYEQEKASCWQVYSIVTDYYKPNPDRLRDWVSTPKSNGYESLHTTVMSRTGQWVEVQIRTRRMDDIAEKGYAAHWKYKEANQTAESGLDGWISKVRDMLVQAEGSAIEFVDDFRSNLFNEEVYIFTPKGELRILPNGATALDFAFEIHSEIGLHCIGAKVNHKLVPLSYILNNGDQVEILTSKKQKPSEDWLKFVVSSKAKSKIKDFIKETRRQLVLEGKELLVKKLPQYSLEYSDELLNELRAYFNAKTHTDLFYKFGKGQYEAKDLKRFQQDREAKQKSQRQKISDAKSFEKIIKEVKGEGTDILLIGEDMDKIDYTLAKCCNPIAGDEVFGFVTVNEGIKIHRTSCPNALELMSHYGYRVVKAKWTSQKEIEFLCGLKVKGTDRVGVINDISKVISAELRVNIRSLSIESNNGLFEGTVMLYVMDTTHLDTLISKLAQVEGVHSIHRFT